MHLAVSILLAIVMAAQSALGCCRHNAPDCTTSEVSTREKVQVAKGCCKGTAKDEPAERPSQTPQAPCQVQCHGICQFLPVEKQQVEQPVASWFEFVSPENEPAIYLSLLERRHEELGIHGGSPQLRLHLLLQLLLI